MKSQKRRSKEMSGGTSWRGLSDGESQCNGGELRIISHTKRNCGDAWVGTVFPSGIIYLYEECQKDFACLRYF